MPWKPPDEAGIPDGAEDRPPCVATRADGKPCRSRLIFDKDAWLCFAHSPQGTEVLTKARRHRTMKEYSEKERRKPPNRFFREGWDEHPRRAPSVVAHAFGVDATTVTRWYAWTDFEQAKVEDLDSWEPPPKDYPDEWWELTIGDLGALEADFLWFRGEFFESYRGEPFLTPPFQLEWVRAILTAIIVGGRLVILSPPRHGKTELLIHFCVWLIARFPNIRIVWVGGNEDIARQAVESAKDHLTANDLLISKFCPPGYQFEPGPGGGSWASTKFVVATRTIVGLKQPTMRAVGRGGRIRSQDTDFIVCDDIEDEKSTVQPMTREETRRWWTTGPDSRKEEHTALFYIGSRAHPDDLGGHLLENPAYESVVEHAHDPTCKIPQDLDHYDEHTECMLFPELRSFRWLMDQKQSAETVGGQAIWEMLYQNLSAAAGMMTFTAETVDRCLGYTHAIGQIPKPIRGDADPAAPVGGISLVGGLDPSHTGYQAAVLWAYQVSPKLHMWLVDLENNLGGGIPQARKTIERWEEKYGSMGFKHWVVEKNLYWGGIVDDEKIVEFTTNHGITLESFDTYRNKLDNRLGVTSMAPLFANRDITLPYADGPSKEKTDVYRRQLIYWEGTAKRNRNTKAGYKSDLVMAGWFPMDVIRRAGHEVIAEQGVEYTPSYQGFGQSQWSEPPWRGYGRGVAPWRQTG